MTENQFRAWLKVRVDNLASRISHRKGGVAGGPFYRSVDFLNRDITMLADEANEKILTIKKS